MNVTVNNDRETCRIAAQTNHNDEPFDIVRTSLITSFDAGVPIKVMSDRLGHATTSFTMDVYMHAIPAVEDDAADLIADLMFGGNEDNNSDSDIDDSVRRSDDPDSATDDPSAS